MNGSSSMGMSAEAHINSNKKTDMNVGMVNHYDVTCLDFEGNFKWSERIHNLVTNQGLSFAIQTLFTGQDAKPTDWFVGLKNTGAPAAANAASALPNVGAWTEYTDYSETVRQTYQWANEASQSTTNAANKAIFTIQSPAADVYGVFLVDSNAKNTNTSATVLYGVGNFPSAKAVDISDTLNVTVVLSAASAP
jgi:hypothetical protein